MRTSKTTNRGIYLLPNLLTTAGLFAAFYAIVSALKGHYNSAAMAIFIAMIADILDGRIARLTGTSSNFGKEYDSLADMVSFGLAPALVVYSLALQSLGKVGWLIAFVYTATAALRLARFNTQTNESNKRYFSGLPSPAAAGLIASMVWLADSNQWHSLLLSLTFACLTFFAGVLMVSNVKYYSFKEFDFRGRVPFIAILVVLAGFVAISLDPPLILFGSFAGYALSGPLHTVHRIIRAYRHGRK